MAIPHFLEQNIGSVIKIEYAPYYAFLTFKSDPDTGIINGLGIALAMGYTWETIYCTQDTMGHQQDLQNEVNGESYAQQVVGFIPGDEPAIEAALRSLSRTRFVLRITLPNDFVKIVGTPSQPLDFIIKSNTGTTAATRAGTGITFTGQTDHRASFYIP